MSKFGKNCNSDPTGGCTDGSGNLLASIAIGNEAVVSVLNSINVNLEAILAQQEDCCEETNNNLIGIQERLDQLIANFEECCAAIISRLDTIIGLEEAPITALVSTFYDDHVCVLEEEATTTEEITTT